MVGSKDECSVESMDGLKLGCDDEIVAIELMLGGGEEEKEGVVDRIMVVDDDGLALGSMDGLKLGCDDEIVAIGSVDGERDG